VGQGAEGGLRVHHTPVENLSAVMSDQIFKQIFNLKFMSKTLQRSHRKCEKEERQEKRKVKSDMEKGNLDGARIHAQNVIRKRSEGMNYLRLSSRIDAVASRLETQAKMNLVNRSMAAIVQSLDRAISSQNFEQITSTMDTFERQFEHLDIQAEFVENAMLSTTTASTPSSDVDTLLREVADENGLELNLNLPSTVQAAGTTQLESPVGDGDELRQRLDALKAK